MQPYVFPYLGYFQLIKAVEVFVIYNDVKFIKKGWINRNRILLNKKEYVFTIPCVRVSQNKQICETNILVDNTSRRKLIETIRVGYKNAPCFDAVFPMIEKVLLTKFDFIDQLAIESLATVCSFLGLKINFKESKSSYDNVDLVGQDRLIDICLAEQIPMYVNPIGGMELYSKEVFKKRGVELMFLKSLPIIYNQYGGEFIPNLSIIDVLMFNEPAKVLSFVNKYALV